MNPKIIGNIVVTDIPITDIYEIQKLANNGKSVYDRSSDKIYPAAVLLNWNFSVILSRIDYKYFYHTVNIKGLKHEVKPRLINYQVMRESTNTLA